MKNWETKILFLIRIFQQTLELLWSFTNSKSSNKTLLQSFSLVSFNPLFHWLSSFFFLNKLFIGYKQKEEEEEEEEKRSYPILIHTLVVNQHRLTIIAWHTHFFFFCVSDEFFSSSILIYFKFETIFLYI
jgi:hypothetical protein